MQKFNLYEIATAITYCTEFIYVCTFFSGNWEKLSSHHLTKSGKIGISFNTDGVSPFKSSLLTIWPIFLALANLPPKVRTLKRNIIITCVFWIAETKPSMPVFLGHFKKIIDRINTTGLVVKTRNGLKKFNLKPLFGVFDLVAKAPIMNMMQFNGKYGCPSCLHPGLRVGRLQTYPPGSYTLRTSTSIKMAADKAEKDIAVIDGIKGSSILAKIVDVPLGAPTDYMHCVLEGVVKRLLDQWISSTFKPYYINKRKIEQIDESLIIQRPPHDFSRAPRSIQKHRKFWKASEYRYWLPLPLLSDFLPPLNISGRGYVKRLHSVTS